MLNIVITTLSKCICFCKHCPFSAQQNRSSADDLRLDAFRSKARRERRDDLHLCVAEHRALRRVAPSDFNLQEVLRAV
jgi:hypothetical protein